MAVPTVTACAPATVFTGGQLVVLTGTGFRGPYPLPASGPVPTPPPTMDIRFDGVPATKVSWLSATRVSCIAPNHDPGAVDVSVQNLDADGDPISGELVVASGLVTYARADLSFESDFTRLTRALLRLLKQQTIENVVQTIETDYTDDATALQFNFVNVSKLPCVVLMAPTTKIDSFYDLDLIPERATGYATFEQRRLMRTVDVTWKILVIDDHQVRIQNLLALVQQFFTLNNWLYLDRDPADLSLGQVRYEMQCGEFGSIGTPNTNNLRAFNGDVTVRGFTYEDVAGAPGTMLSRQGGTADTISFGIAGESRSV